jgi:chromosome partitioning protein
VYDVLLENATVAEAAVVPEQSGGYDVLGANRELAGAEVELVSLERRERRLKEALAPWRRLRLRADRLPAFAVHADAERPVRGAWRDRAHAVRVLRAGRPDRSGQHHQAGARQPEPRPADHRPAARDVRPRITLQQQVSDQLKAHFGDKVFDTVIPRNVRLAEAPSYGLPGVVFDPAAKGSKAFVEFAEEMVARASRNDEGSMAILPAWVKRRSYQNDR